jgi:hypothetical protein
MGIDPALYDLGGRPGRIGCFMSIFQALLQLRPGITAQIELKPPILLGQGEAEKLSLLSPVQLLDVTLFQGELIFLQDLTEMSQGLAACGHAPAQGTQSGPLLQGTQSGPETRHPGLPLLQGTQSGPETAFLAKDDKLGCSRTGGAVALGAAFLRLREAGGGLG